MWPARRGPAVAGLSWRGPRGGADLLPGAVCLCAGPFRVPAGQSSPSLTQLSALRQGRPAGPAALGEQRAPRCPGRRSEQPRVLQPSLEERKKQAESRAEAPGWAAKNADTTLQDDSAGGASAASLAPPGWTGPTLLVNPLFPDATLSPSRLLGLGWQEALMSFFPNVSFFHFGHASKRPVSNSTKHFVVAQSCPTLCDPTGCSMPGLPVPHHLPESAQIHVHRASDATWLLLNNLTGGTLGFFPAGVTPTRPTKPHGDTKFGTKAGMKQSDAEPRRIYARQRRSAGGGQTPTSEGRCRCIPCLPGSQAHRHSPTEDGVGLETSQETSETRGQCPLPPRPHGSSGKGAGTQDGGEGPGHPLR